MRFPSRPPLPVAAVTLGILLSASAPAQVPGLLHHQGRVLVGSTPFTGTGSFRFALVNADGTVAYWRNSPDGDANGIPDAAVSVPVSRGLYSVLLGDISLPNMAAVPPSAFSQSAVHLRVWFDDGVRGLERLVPDQRVAPVGYAFMAATVSDGAVTPEKLSAGLQSTITSLSNQVTAVSLPSMPTVAMTADDPALLALGYVPFMSVPAPAWVAGAPGDGSAPGPRSGHTGVWSGDAFIVWGGRPGAGTTTDTGSMYRPSTDSWTPINPHFARPSARAGHTAVWTGTEMVVWGGLSGSLFLDSGARFQPVPQSWTALPVGPSGRDRHVAVWTGGRMVVWGGRNAGGLLSDGSVLDPAAGWSALTLPNAPTARERATAVWTGQEMIVWGGIGETQVRGDGGRLGFSGNTPQSWRGMTGTGAPSPRYGHSAVWTGSRMLVWGGVGPDGVLLADGASYDPATDGWQALSLTGAASARMDHGAVWTGTEMIVVGGQDELSPLSTAFALDPVRNRWRSLSTSGGPVARLGPAVVWTGTELEVFGGESVGVPVASLQRLVPQPSWHFYRKP